MAMTGVGQRERVREGFDLVDAYMWSVSALGLAAISALWLQADLAPIDFGDAVPWILAALVGDALLVRYSRSVALGASISVTLGAALVLPPPIVALVGFFSVFQLPGRSRRSITKALFNRVDVGCAAACAAIVVNLFQMDLNTWPAVVLVAVLALAADAAVNAGLMLPVVCLREGCSPRQAARMFLGASPLQTGVIYASAALAAPVIAMAWEGAGAWGLSAALVAVALAGFALRLGQRVGTAEAELKITRAVIGESTEQVALERRDERQTLAGELHDDVLPALFKVHLMGEVIRHDLASGRLLDLEEDVVGLLEATEAAQRNVRDVVGSLRKSPLGVRGLARSVAALASHLEIGGAPRIHVSVHEVMGTERALTVAYQVTREALTNAAKYAKASTIQVKVESDGGLVRVAVIDDGCGFQGQQGQDQSGHFGIELMRERVNAVGGTFVLDTRLGAGTVVTASIPPDA